MPASARRAPLMEYVPDLTVDPGEYEPFVGQRKMDRLRELAAPLAGKGWANVNSTFIGGGVAEMLRGVVPLARALDIDAHWHVIQGDRDFFNVTKKFHNMLQGVDIKITLEEIFHAYLNTIDENTRNTFITSDMVVIHDPQPAAMVMNGVIYGNVLWRCHIDTSRPNQTVWRFLLPYINQCAAAVFTMPEFMGPGLQVPVYQIMPCIDPLAVKNRQLTRTQALDILHPIFVKEGLDPERPILAAVSRYDIHKNQATIIKAFKKLRSESPRDPAPYLVFLGNTADDDPEGEAMLDSLRCMAGDDSDIVFLCNVDDNDAVVGALMRACRAFVHVSSREGFGLVVTEAMWQGAPVIGSRVGGIVTQVVDGVSGCLVEPMDADAVAEAMAHFLDNEDSAKALGENGREHVRDNFLLPELVRRYLTLLGFYTHIQREPPDFRLSDLTYSEVINLMRPRPPLFPE